MGLIFKIIVVVVLIGVVFTFGVTPSSRNEPAALVQDVVKNLVTSASLDEPAALVQDVVKNLVTSASLDEPAALAQDVFQSWVTPLFRDDPAATETQAQPAPTRRDPPATPRLTWTLPEASPNGEIAITEAQLNQDLAQLDALEGDDVPIRDVQVQLLSDNRVLLNGTTVIADRAVDMQATLNLSMRNGAVRLEVEEVKAGVLPLPSAVVEQVIVLALGVPDLNAIALPPDITSVEVRQGVIVITR